LDLKLNTDEINMNLTVLHTNLAIHNDVKTSTSLNTA